MKKMMSIVLAFIFITAVIAGCSSKSLKEDDTETARIDKKTIQPASSIMITEEETANQEEKVAVTVYFIDDKTSKLVAEKRFLPKSKVKDSTALAQNAFKELFKGPISGNLKAAFPKELKVPTVKVEKETAVVDISKDFITKLVNEKDKGKLMLYSMVNTLTAIEGINEVKFTIEGKELKVAKGDFKFDKPLKADKSLIKENKE